jgi:hypothetical protein
MASLTRVHPVAVALDISGPGPDTAFIEIDYLAAVNAKTGPESTQAKVKELLSGYGQVTFIGELVDSNTRQVFGIEALTQDNTVAAGGTLTVIQAALRALGTVDSIDLSSGTAIRGMAAWANVIV